MTEDSLYQWASGLLFLSLEVVEYSKSLSATETGISSSHDKLQPHESLGSYADLIFKSKDRGPDFTVDVSARFHRAFASG